MQQWIKCILVLTWKMAMVGAQCPGFTCSGSSCYLIYPTSSRWKYKKPNGDIKNADGNVYKSPNCYKFIMNKEGRSCNDAQRECEQVGGNITVINSIAEYSQLTENVLHILGVRKNSKFSVHIQNLPRYSIGCATITVEDGTFSNRVRIKNTECATTRIMVDTFVCESTDLNAGICPLPTTAEKQITQTPISVHQTTSIWPTVFNESIFTVEGTEYTFPIMNQSKENQSKKESGHNSLMVAALASIVGTGTAVVMILLIYSSSRRTHKRKEPRYLLGPNQHLPSTNLSIKDGLHDRGTVSFSDAGVVCGDHQDLGESYNILDATDMHSPSGTAVVNDVYATPYTDTVTKYGMQDQGYDMLNATDMESAAVELNALGGDVYAVPNKKSKGRKEQDVDGPYDTLDASDMQPESEQHRRESDDALHDALYVNATHCPETAAYDSINANEKHSGKEKILDGAYDVPYTTESSTGDRQQDHDGTYDMLNRAESQSNPGKCKSDNEYDKLNTAHHMPPKADVYPYVETSIGIEPPGENNAYDKLQRNTELDDALTNDNFYNSLQ